MNGGGGRVSRRTLNSCLDPSRWYWEKTLSGWLIECFLATFQGYRRISCPKTMPFQPGIPFFFFQSSPKDIFLLLVLEGERERNRTIDQLPPISTLTGDRTRHLLLWGTRFQLIGLPGQGPAWHFLTVVTPSRDPGFCASTGLRHPYGLFNLQAEDEICCHQGIAD